MSSSDDLQEWYSQRDALIKVLEDDPGNEELLAMKKELDDLIQEFEAAAVPAPKSPEPASADAPKWDKTNHPAFQKQGQPSSTDEATQVTFKQNDVVLARWAQDRQFYEARITSITGSSTDPVYYVKFTKYDEHASVRRHELKPLLNPSRKRKADDAVPTQPTTSTSTSASASTPPVAVSSNVISAAPTVDPSLAAKAKQDPNTSGDISARSAKAMRQMPKSKALKNSQNSWQNFQKKQSGKKDSMFRTQEGNPNARVGFTGSGHEMRKDATRKRHQYSRDEDDT